MEKKKTSLKDIAEKKRVGREMARKIRETAAALHYTTDQVAKSLRTRKTNTIGLVVADINYHYSRGVMKALEAACLESNLSVICYSSEENNKKFAQILKVLVDRQVDGLILVPVEGCDNELLELTKQKIPFVLIDRALPGLGANSVTADNKGGAYAFTSHLLYGPYSRVGFISCQSRLSNFADRKKGYLTAMKIGDRVDPLLIKEIPNLHPDEEVREAIDQLLALTPRCDSILFATETLAVSGLRYINELGIKVPEDLGIVSFEESQAFELFRCPISHGRQPLRQIAGIAIHLLRQAMHGARRGSRRWWGRIFTSAGLAGRNGKWGHAGRDGGDGGEGFVARGGGRGMRREGICVIFDLLNRLSRIGIGYG
jgi:LacI family transcriptional regulator